jgi:serine/threonine protein kinase
MEYFDGEELLNFKNTYPDGMPEHLAVEIMAQLLKGIRQNFYMDENKKKIFVAHNDLKPSNIMIKLNPDGSPQIKIIDYGFASVKSTNRFNSLNLRMTSLLISSSEAPWATCR